MTQLLRDALKIRTKFAVQRLLSRLLAVDRLPGSKSEPGHRNVRVVHQNEAAGAAAATAVAQAADIPVSLAHASRLRATDHRQDRVAHLQRSGQAGRHP